LDEFAEAFGKGGSERFGLYGGHRDPAAWGRAARALAEVGNGYGSIIDRLRKAADEIEALHSLTANPKE
jgi:hypothetical protein